MPSHRATAEGELTEVGDDSAINPVGRAYLGDVFMRHPLTTRNQEELDIAAKADSILDRNLKALKRTPEGGGNQITPVGSPSTGCATAGSPRRRARRTSADGAPT
jgi:hypothetical protein